MAEPAAPMGRIDAVEVGSRKLTIQTEYFERPERRIETKIYVGGALKKVYTEDLADVADVQRHLNEIHQSRMKDLIESLQGLQSK